MARFFYCLKPTWLDAEYMDRIAGLIEPTLEDLGYELVRATLLGAERKTFQVMAERRDGRPMTVEDCSKISRALSAVLEVEDPIPGAYNLEVSSPGIDRPLVRLKDFETYAGFEAKVETGRPIEGRKRYRGRLKGLTKHEEVRITLPEGEEVLLPFKEIAKAKLVLTDDLIDFVTAEQEQQEQ